MNAPTHRAAFSALVALSLATSGCTTETKSPAPAGGGTAAGNLAGSVKIDGSSTVYPLSSAVAEELRTSQPDIDVTVGESGTGGGFKKFAAGELDISDASRPIKDGEAKDCAEKGIEYIEIPVAYDGLSVVVHAANTWCDTLTVAELHAIWKPDSAVKTWKDVRPEWPDRAIKLYGPGTDSGTFDYFTEAINGKAQVSRADYTPSEDDNVLVQGVSGDEGALGYFGFAYYVENKDKLKVVKIDGGKGPIEPTEATINDGTYAPLSRPIFIYVATKSAERPEVAAFVAFYIDHAAKLAKDVGYVALPDEAYRLAKQRFEKRIAGSAFAHRTPGRSLVDVLGDGLAN